MTTGARCVVIDDDELARELYKRRLGLMGFSIEAYADPLVALDALAQPGAEPADAWFVDHRMPRLDGLELLERLAVNGASLPRLQFLCSAAPLQCAVRQRAERLGVLEFSKDWLRERDALRRWMSDRKLLDQR